MPEPRQPVGAERREPGHGRGRAHRPDPLDRRQSQRRRLELRAGRDALRQRRRRRLRLRHPENCAGVERRGPRPPRPARARSCGSTATATSRHPATRSPARAPAAATSTAAPPPATGARRRGPGGCATRSASQFDPNTPGRVYINDVGQGLREEIDAGVAGADYGWNVREGTCANPALGPANCGSAPPAGMTNPIFDYGRADGCVSITGGAFVPDGDRLAGRVPRQVPVRRLRLRQDLPPRSERPGLHPRRLRDGPRRRAAPTHLEFGPSGSTQALYYTTYAGGGQVRRISFTATNTPPIAAISATPSSGPAPLAVDFDGGGSSDPDPGDTIDNYAWTFGDGSAVVNTATPTVAHTYAAGNYTASVRVTDNRGAVSAPAFGQHLVGQHAADGVDHLPGGGHDLRGRPERDRYRAVAATPRTRPWPCRGRSCDGTTPTPIPGRRVPGPRSRSRIPHPRISRPSTPAGSRSTSRPPTLGGSPHR